MSNQVTFKQLFTAVDNLATEVGKEIKKTNQKIGDTSALKTTNKGDVVSAINEVKDAKDGLIKDGARASDTTYSSEKIEAYVADKVSEAKSEVKSEILGGAEEAYDTLIEIQEKIKSGDSAVNGLLDALGKRLRIDEAMELDEEQQKNVAKSLGLPEEVDFVAKFTAALN